jgi:hypothetical protein
MQSKPAQISARFNVAHNATRCKSRNKPFAFFAPRPPFGFSGLRVISSFRDIRRKLIYNQIFKLPIALCLGIGARAAW